MINFTKNIPASLKPMELAGVFFHQEEDEVQLHYADGTVSTLSYTAWLAQLDDKLKLAMNDVIRDTVAYKEKIPVSEVLGNF